MEILLMLVLVLVVGGILVATRMPKGRASGNPTVRDREPGRD